MPCDCLLCGRLQCAYDSSSDGHDTAALADRSIDRLRRGCGERISLAVQSNFIHTLNTERRKRSKPHVQRNARNLDALRRQRLKHLRRKMQSGCRRGDGTMLARKHRLVALAIGFCVVTANVGRQRHVANAIENCKEIGHLLKAQHPLTKLPTLQYFCFQRDRLTGP